MTLENRLEMLETLLGIEPGSCSGDPTTCTGCTPESCAFQSNRITELGSLVVTLLDEFRWHRAWATEMEALQVVPEGTSKRVELRVRREHLRERLREMARTLSGVRGVEVMGESVQDRISQLRDELRELDAQLGDAS